MSENELTQQAIKYIEDCCSCVGTFHGPSSVNKFLSEIASDMAASKPTNVFPGRYLEHVAYAVKMAAALEGFTTSPAAIASLYLVTRFEYYFRILSGKLNGDGSWISSSDQNAVHSIISDRRLKSKRISSVSLAYKIMLTNNSLNLTKICSQLDKSLYKETIKVTGGMEVSDIGSRIEFGRHVTTHGHWGDMSSEAIFYGLMTAIVFYNQS